MNSYKEGREDTLRMLHSFRNRPFGFDGVLADLRAAEDFLSFPVPLSLDAQQYRAGIRSVITECHTAIRTWEVA